MMTFARGLFLLENLMIALVQLVVAQVRVALGGGDVGVTGIEGQGGGGRSIK